MSTARIKSLLDKLNERCLQTLEAAAAFAGMRGHYEVCIEHMVVKLLEKDQNDFGLILHHCDVNLDHLWQAMLDNLGHLRSGNQNKPALSPQLLEWLERAWTLSSLQDPQAKLRSQALLEALLDLVPRLPGTAWLSLEDLCRDLPASRLADLTRFSAEAPVSPSSPDRGDIPASGASPTNVTKTPQLDLYTTDFTARAATGAIDPVLGRNDEIRQIIDILTRRRKNNPILVGEPGVGKTAVVEGLALRIAEGEVPESLKQVRLAGLDLGRLQAGAGVKGEFEKRLKAVIEEVIASPSPIVLFIDEAHTLIGAGGEAGQGDAANLLKPALARGELRTLAATTWSEYKQYFERDAALERRFQMVKVEEPAQEDAIVMLNGLKGHYQTHHGVLITDSAVEAAVRLSSRYINGRYLPDKAIDLLDTAAARVCMGQAAPPAELETLREHLAYIERRRRHLTEEATQGIPADPKLVADLQREETQARQDLAGLEERWRTEQTLVDQIHKARNGQADALCDLEPLQQRLQQLQQPAPLVQAEVDADTIARVVSDWTGIPLGRMIKNDLTSLLELEQTLSRRIIGQQTAIHAIGQSIRCSKAGLRDHQAPVGVFLLTGPSGVGKTETARAVADTLYGGERFMVTINMSEYQEAHSVSQLKGSPPGYVGYGEGGILTEAVRQRPYSVILLDEVEKAHPDVLNMFYQVFDRGFMRDGEGRVIDFKNTVLILTSNLGAEAILDRCDSEALSLQEEGGLSQPAKTPVTHGELIETVRPVLAAHFPAALLARMQIVPLRPLTRETLQQIIALKLDQIARRLHDAHDIRMHCTPEVIEHLASRCHPPETGARAIDTLIDQNLLPGISRSLLGFMVDEEMPQLMALEIDEKDELSCVFSDLVEEEDEPQIAETGTEG